MYGIQWVTSGERFRKPTSSRRTILSVLREFSEFGIIFFADWDQEILWEHGKGGETRSAEFFNTNPTLYWRSWSLEPLESYWRKLILTMVWWITRDIRSRKRILENTRTHWNFKSRKVNFKIEVRWKSADLQITMHWIKEVEIAKSIDELMTWQSIADFPDFEMHDAKIASALKKISSSVHFRRRVSVKEQRAQKHDRFLRGRQIACMIYEHISSHRSFWSCRRSIRSIRYTPYRIIMFDRRWSQALLASSEILTEIVLEGLYKSKLQNSVQLRAVLAIYEPSERSKWRHHPTTQDWRQIVRRHVDQTVRTRNFRARKELKKE